MDRTTVAVTVYLQVMVAHVQDTFSILLACLFELLLTSHIQMVSSGILLQPHIYIFLLQMNLLKLQNHELFYLHFIWGAVVKRLASHEEGFWFEPSGQLGPVCRSLHVSCLHGFSPASLTPSHSSQTCLLGQADDSKLSISVIVCLSLSVLVYRPAMDWQPLPLSVSWHRLQPPSMLHWIRINENEMEKWMDVYINRWNIL